MAEGGEAPLEEPRRLLLLGRDEPDDILVEALGRELGVQVGVEAVGVVPLDEGVDHVAHGLSRVAGPAFSSSIN